MKHHFRNWNTVINSTGINRPKKIECIRCKTVLTKQSEKEDCPGGKKKR